MMTVPEDGAERLAEIFREIFALSGTKQPNPSKSTAADDSVKLLDTQGPSGTPVTCAPKEKQASDKRSVVEARETPR
jgi:hypothetical protein